MRTTLVLLTAAIGFTYTSLAVAENPSREKCTCDIEVESVRNNGAWVKNATSCWSTELHGQQWCDITVQTLRNSPTHNAIVLQLRNTGDDPTTLTSVMVERFNEFAADTDSSQSALDLAQARDLVPKLLKNNDKLVQECARAMTDGKRGFRREGTEGFQCTVGESSGWLRIEFQIGDVKLAYMIAPV